jgi:hypothetical protein
MAKQTINIGTSPNDGTGTPLRTSFDYCNLNFTELYTATGPSGNNIVVPGTATITGDLTVRTTGLTVNSSGVGVGLTAALGAGNIQIGAGKYLGYSGTSYITPEDNVQGARIKANQVLIDATDAKFNIGGTEAMRLNSSGNLAFANGKGIDFAATTSGSGTMTSELLNDYEEGTWTGTLKGSVSDPTIAVTATGAYTKVGRLVTVTIGYSNVLTTGASGNVTIAGLPFTGAASSAGSVITFDMFTTSTTLACWNTGTTIAFYVSGGFIPATHNAGASRSVAVTITYYV